MQIAKSVSPGWRRLAASALAMAGLAGTASAQDIAPSPVEGEWRTLNGTEIAVRPCDAGFCGYLEWIVIPKENSAQCQADRTAFGAQMMDFSNPDPTLRTRPLVGLNILTMTPTADPNAFTGRIYNVQDGQSYDGTITIVGDTTMRLSSGCAFGVCLVTQDWPRVPVRDGAPDFTCGAG